MMKYLKYTVFTLIFAIFASLIGAVSYVMPHYSAGVVAGVEVKRADKDGIINKNNVADGPTHDVYFIYTHQPNDDTKVQVYRNEDTRWGFPFYFKFNSADLAGMAQSLDKQLVQIKYYGWRIKIFNTFPNVVSIKPLSNVDSLSHPIFSYILYVILLIGLFFTIQLVRGWFDSRK